MHSKQWDQRALHIFGVKWQKNYSRTKLSKPNGQTKWRTNKKRSKINGHVKNGRTIIVELTGGERVVDKNEIC